MRVEWSTPAFTCRSTPKVAKNILLGKQSSAILNKVKTPFLQAFMKQQKVAKFQAKGGQSLW